MTFPNRQENGEGVTWPILGAALFLSTMKRAAMIGCTYYHTAMAPALAEPIPAREKGWQSTLVVARETSSGKQRVLEDYCGDLCRRDT
jgi:hypothetical protein